MSSLRPASPDPPTRSLSPPSAAYWVQALAHAPGGHTYNLEASVRATPRLAMRWLRERASHIADQLDPRATYQLRSWSSGNEALEHALALLVQGNAYTHTILDDGTLYVLLASPLAG